MQNTSYDVGFVSGNTVQLRLELGEVINGVQQPASEIPDHDFENDAGFIFKEGQILGRITGNRDFYMPLDQYLASPLDPLFDLTDPFADTASAPVDVLSQWTVKVNGQEVAITGLSRKSNILDTAETGWFEFEFTTIQNVFFELESPIPEGATVEISFDDPAFEAITGSYDPENTISEAIHVNLVGFDPQDSVKAAFLSSWNGWSVEVNGDVAQTYIEGTGFDVVDDATGQVVKSGQIELFRAETDPQNFWNNYQFTDVFRMDFSDITTEGTYHIRVDDIGRSPSFEISDDHWGDIFDVSFSGYYHLRSGIALEEEYTDWTRPRSFHPDDGFVIQETTLDLSDTSEGPLGGSVNPFTSFAGLTTGNVLEDAWGGWHDAGDYDRRSQHLEASRKLMELLEIAPNLAARNASIPEQNNGIPDLLDEAMWTVDLFRRLQNEDGGVRGGIESESFPARGEGSWADSQNHYAYAPDQWSSYEFAAAAAKAAFLFETYDPSRVAEWTDAAEAAWDWAEANPKSLSETEAIARMATARVTAAAELFRLTEDDAYDTAFQESFAYADGISAEWYEHQFEAAFTYARTQGADQALAALGQQAILANAEFERDISDRGGFGETINPYAPYGWGNTSTHADEAELFIRAHALTGDDAWIPEVEADLQYPLGANPLNLSYVTGLGSRQPEEILHGDLDVLGRDELPPGITLYGPYSIHDYGQDFYHDIMWADVFPNFWRTPISESFQGFSVFVPSTEFTVQQGITDTTYAAGYLANLQAGPAPIDGTDAAETVTGTAGDDIVNGYGGNDILDLSDGGSDDARAGEGNDGIYFGAAFDRTDLVDGGAGSQDQLGLQGDYSGGVTFGPQATVGIEQVVLMPGNMTTFGAPGNETYSYDLTLVDANVGSGERLTFQANQLRAGEDFTLDASAEQDGYVFTYAGLGTEDLTGGQMDDAFFFGTGRFSAGDRIDGQGGFDSVGLQGDYASGVTIGVGQLVNVELLALLSNTDTRFGGEGSGAPYMYAVTMANGAVQAGESFAINANSLAGDEMLTFDGSAETGGRFSVFSGKGDDAIQGSQQDDVLSGGGGEDTIAGNAGLDLLTGGADSDTFQISLGGDTDVVTDWSGPGADADVFQLVGTGLGFGDLTFVDHAAGATVGGHTVGAASASFTIGSGADQTIVVVEGASAVQIDNSANFDFV
ncbi:MAG: glycoside hydrolase family 9 protein [Pseudomonadota bacterium]